MTAPFGAPIITEPGALSVGADAVAAMIADLPAGAQGAISAAFGDPGLDAMRRVPGLAVTGIGEASFLEAAEAGRRYAIVTTTPLLDHAIRARVAASGTAAQFIGLWYTPGDPAALTFQPALLHQALATGIRAAIGAGAEAIIIGGGPLAQAARALAPEFDVPIIEPVPAAMRRMRRLLGA